MPPVRDIPRIRAVIPDMFPKFPKLSKFKLSNRYLKLSGIFVHHVPYKIYYKKQFIIFLLVDFVWFFGGDHV